MRETSPTDWRERTSPVDVRLTGVVETVTGPWAACTDGAVLGSNDENETVIASVGPAGTATELADLAVTDDGKRIWVAGSDGTLAAYDVTTERLSDHSAADDRAGTWTAIAVTGPANAERLLVGNDSGAVVPVTVDADGCPDFGEAVVPCCGASISALAVADGWAYAADANGAAFVRPTPDDDEIRDSAAGSPRDEASLDSGDGALDPGDGALDPGDGEGPTDGARRTHGAERTDGGDRDGTHSSDGRTVEDATGDGPRRCCPDGDWLSEPADGAGDWRRIGIRSTEVDVRDAAADGDRLFVVAGDGLVYRYDRACRNWTPVDVAADSLRAVDVVGESAVVAGDDGVVARRTVDRGWRRIDAPVDETLTGVALGTRTYAVTDGGTILERGADE